MNIRANLFFNVAVLTVLVNLMLVKAGKTEELQAPQKVIQSISDQILTRLKDQSFRKNFLEVTHYVNSLIEPNTDFDKIAPLVLGANWKIATAEEQQSFKKEFQTLLVRVYSRAFVEYKNWSINYLPLTLANTDKKTMVKTRIIQPSTEDVSVDYRMFLSNGVWKVYDIVIGGVSLVTNYRSIFNDEIQRKGSISAVIERIKQRNAEALQVPVK